MLLVAAAVLTSLGFAVYSRVEGPSFVLGWFALVPWLAALDRVVTIRGALIAGLVLCETFTFAVFFWFAGAIQNYAGVSLPAAAVALLLTAPLLQSQFVPFALARTVARRAGLGWFRVALAGAGVYVGSEWLLPKLFADTLGHGQFASAPLRQAADLAGAPGLTFLLVLGNECVLALLRPRAGRALPAASLAAMIAALLFYGELRLNQFAPLAERETLAAGIVQADISQYARLAGELGTFDATRMILDRHFALSTRALESGPLDLIVWPETVYPTTFAAPKSEDGAAFGREIAGFVAYRNVSLVFGAYDADGDDEYNSAILLEPAPDAGVQFDSYRKALLFPLTERVPAWLDSPTVRGFLPWLGTWKAGGGPGVLDLHRRDGSVVRLAPLICYDAVAPSLAIEAVRRGAEVIVTLSNDSWFADGGGPRLHLVVSAFRSLETRRPQLRATNTGISAVVDQTGELLATIGVHEISALVARVAPERDARTLMLAWGDWFGPVALVIGLAALALPRRGRGNGTERDSPARPSRIASSSSAAPRR